VVKTFWKSVKIWWS